MTTEEFIQKVNELNKDERGELVAFLKNNGVPAIADTDQYYTLAYLPGYTKRWVFTANSHSFPGSVLKLMGELADSKYHERVKKYVILNGNPSGKCWNVFWINKEYQNLDEYHCVNRDDLINHMSYTTCEFVEAKRYLPETLQKAVDVLTVSLSEALEMGENNE